MEKNEKSKETFFERNKIKIILITAIIIQTVIFIIAGINKSHISIKNQNPIFILPFLPQ
jgi:hypothetical protein